MQMLMATLGPALRLNLSYFCEFSEAQYIDLAHPQVFCPTDQQLDQQLAYHHQISSSFNTLLVKNRFFIIKKFSMRCPYHGPVFFPNICEVVSHTGTAAELKLI